jgi:iron(III) transport system ATP-binding protein
MLAIAGVSKRYSGGGADVLNDISFSVTAGTFFTLLGPSGCGKTTMLRCIAGLEMPERGEIRIDSRIVFSAAQRTLVPAHRRDIAMVFQSYAIWPHMTVRENVSFPLEVRHLPAGDVAKGVERALAMVGLEELGTRPASRLSGGQQQRVAFARAIVKGAKLLLLDEPLSNLDAELRIQMRTELRDLQRRLGTTAVYVTHDQEEAMSLSDRIAVMVDGRLVETGAPEELYLRPRHPFTASFLGHAEVIPADAAVRTEEGVRAVTALGPLVARLEAETVPDRPAVMIRPEHIELLADDAKAGLNVVEGHIVTRTFLGKLVDYRVEVGGRTLRVQTTSSVLRAPGSTVRLLLPIDRCLIVSQSF